LPEGFRCPKCKQPASVFVKIEEEKKLKIFIQEQRQKRI